MRTRAERRKNFFKNRGRNTSAAQKRRRPKKSRLKRGYDFDVVTYKVRRFTLGHELFLTSPSLCQAKRPVEQVFEVSFASLF